MEEGVFCGFSESNWLVERHVGQSSRKMNGWVMRPWVREQILRFSVAVIRSTFCIVKSLEEKGGEKVALSSPTDK